MSTASDIRGEGLNLLLELDPETLTLSGRSGSPIVTGIVNRNPQMNPMVDPRTMHFAPSEQSIIWVKRSAIAPIIRTGERLVDANSDTHDVSKVEIIDDVVVLTCRITPGTIGV
jgi:hypothetical protein